jgi:hypothetical protein
MIVFSAAWLVKIVQRIFLYKFGSYEEKHYLCKQKYTLWVKP